MFSAVFKHMPAGREADRVYRLLRRLGVTRCWPPRRNAQTDGITILSDERYARTDTSTEAQALKLMSMHPQAIMMGISATPAALPVVALRHRGYKGALYGNHGIVSPAFVKVDGAAAEGVIAVTSPVVVYDQLSDGNPVSLVTAAFMADYTKQFGPTSVNPFAGYSYDAMLLRKTAVPIALQSGQPDTEHFRMALRAVLEATHELVGSVGVYTMSPPPITVKTSAPRSGEY